MNAIAAKIAAVPAADVETLAMQISREAPGLAALSPQQLQQIAKIAMTQRLAGEFSAKIDIAGIDYSRERETFLNDTRSAHTRRAYAAALGRLETWASRERINPLGMTAAQADQFIRSLNAGGRAAASIRRDIAAASAFFSFLERYHAAVKNPIRGTKLRPPKKNIKDTVIPTPEEFAAIITAMPPIERAIVETLAGRGLRAGALPTLEKKGTRYTGTSKAKELKEGNAAGITLPASALDAIKAAGLDIKKPFAGLSGNAIENRINTKMQKLYKAGKIRAAYSCHDFRHYFAVREYQKNKDIFRLSKLLNHAGVQITQTYLRSLGIEL